MHVARHHDSQLRIVQPVLTLEDLGQLLATARVERLVKVVTDLWRHPRWRLRLSNERPTRRKCAVGKWALCVNVVVGPEEHERSRTSSFSKIAHVRSISANLLCSASRYSRRGTRRRRCGIRRLVGSCCIVEIFEVKEFRLICDILGGAIRWNVNLSRLQPCYNGTEKLRRPRKDVGVPFLLDCFLA